MNTYTLHSESNGLEIRENGELLALLPKALPVLMPHIKKVLASAVDDGGVPYDYGKYCGKSRFKYKGTLPIDETSGVKLAVIFLLTAELTGGLRPRLMAQRVLQFSREEAAYWLGRMTLFNSDYKRWAKEGLAIMLAGSSENDPGVRKWTKDYKSN